MRRIAVIVAVYALVGAAVWGIASWIGRGDTASADLSGPITSTTAAGETAGGSGTPATVGSRPAGQPSPGASATAGSPTARTTTQADPSRPVGSQPPAVREMLPTPSGDVNQPSGLPVHAGPTSPLVTAPLPAAALTRHRIAPGYPRALVGPHQARILTSSVTPAGGVLQVALTASCRKPCDVLKAFRAQLLPRGFREVGSQGVENRPSAAFKHGGDTLMVAVTATTGTTVSYSVYGTLHAAGA